jgi:hypothetical protein
MTTHFADDGAIERIALGLLDRSLPKKEWTHAAHFAAALWLLRQPAAVPLEHRMPSIIRAYNEATGVANTDTGGYHATITQASLRAARAFLGGYPETQPLHEVTNLLLASSLGNRDWPLVYWSRERLFSVEARRAWVAPDLKPLPF